MKNPSEFIDSIKNHWVDIRGESGERDRIHSAETVYERIELTRGVVSVSRRFKSFILEVDTLNLR